MIEERFKCITLGLYRILKGNNMPQISREEFNKIFQEKYLPFLKELEPRRVKVYNRNKILTAFFLTCFLGFFFIFLFSFNPVNSNPAATIFSVIFAVPCFIILFVVLLVCLLIMYKGSNNFKLKLKKDVISKILALYGNVYFSGKKDIITCKNVHSMGLFPRADFKKDDDIIIGLYKGCNFLINECELTHEKSSGKTSTTVTDFKGFILQVQMKKKFSGNTVFGYEEEVKKLKGYEKVELESVEFMKNRKIYSTDQVEARYILTPSFMERLDNLGQVFMTSVSAGQYGISNINIPDSVAKNNNLYTKYVNAITSVTTGVRAAFTDSYAYLFIPTPLLMDLFDIDMSKSLFIPEQFYKIYIEISSILELIDYMKMDKNLGL